MILFQVPTHDILFGPAPIDWCEPNRAQTNPYGWEELHNTYTNLAYVIAGISLFLKSRSSPDLDRPFFFAFCFFTILTGVTSAWFHATLIYVAQKADEFFETASVVALMYYHTHPRVSAEPARHDDDDDDDDADDDQRPSSPSSTKYFTFSIHVVALGLGVLFIPDLFCEVNLLVSVLLCFKAALSRTSTISHGPTQSAVRSTYLTSFACAGAGFALWGVDQAFCVYVQRLNLHAFGWHLLTAAALYLGGSASLALNDALHKQLKSK